MHVNMSVSVFIWGNTQWHYVVKTGIRLTDTDITYL